jgi:hypothetical protein
MASARTESASLVLSNPKVDHGVREEIFGSVGFGRVGMFLGQRL